MAYTDLTLHALFSTHLGIAAGLPNSGAYWLVLRRWGLARERFLFSRVVKVVVLQACAGCLDWSWCVCVCGCGCGGVV